MLEFIHPSPALQFSKKPCPSLASGEVDSHMVSEDCRICALFGSQGLALSFSNGSSQFWLIIATRLDESLVFCKARVFFPLSIPAAQPACACACSQRFKSADHGWRPARSVRRAFPMGMGLFSDVNFPGRGSRAGTRSRAAGSVLSARRAGFSERPSRPFPGWPRSPAAP